MTIKRNASTESADGEWLSIAQAAERLAVSTRTIQRYIRAETLNIRRDERRRVSVWVPETSQPAAPVSNQTELEAINFKLDRMIMLVEKAIRLYEPKTLEGILKKWI